VNIAQSLENLRLERDAVALYDALASIETEPDRAAAFRHIASNERRHADIWAARLRDLGATVPPPVRPRARIRFIILAARLLGTRAVSDLVKSLEGDEISLYDSLGPGDELRAIAADEREHAAIWERLDGDGAGALPAGAGEGPRASATGAAAEPAPDGSLMRSEPAAVGPAGASAGTAGASTRVRGATVHGPQAIARREAWHRTARSGTLRAIIFGVSDGLVSNLALVMGVAGASTRGDFILLAGVAGLLAGAFSMAAGEYISMQSQRELFERQIELERAELQAMPEEEERELAEIYMAKGLPREDAQRVAARLFRDPEMALDTLVREELGLDPDELGSPWGAAVGSFLAFAVGAIIPVVPYVFGNGTVAFVASLGMSLVALFAVGAAVSLLTGRSAVYSGLRQLAIGAAAAAVTFLIGRAIGVGVAG
jgi:VIT1/CCC1 family predicted Fe2+/Mn2+ transporter